MDDCPVTGGYQHVDRDSREIVESSGPTKLDAASVWETEAEYRDILKGAIYISARDAPCPLCLKDIALSDGTDGLDSCADHTYLPCCYICVHKKCIEDSIYAKAKEECPHCKKRFDYEDVCRRGPKWVQDHDRARQANKSYRDRLASKHANQVVTALVVPILVFAHVLTHLVPRYVRATSERFAIGQTYWLLVRSRARAFGGRFADGATWARSRVAAWRTGMLNAGCRLSDRTATAVLTAGGKVRSGVSDARACLRCADFRVRVRERVTESWSYAKSGPAACRRRVDAAHERLAPRLQVARAAFENRVAQPVRFLAQVYVIAPTSRGLSLARVHLARANGFVGAKASVVANQGHLLWARGEEFFQAHVSQRASFVFAREHVWVPCRTHLSQAYVGLTLMISSGRAHIARAGAACSSKATQLAAASSPFFGQAPPAPSDDDGVLVEVPAKME